MSFYILENKLTNRQRIICWSLNNAFYITNVLTITKRRQDIQHDLERTHAASPWLVTVNFAVTHEKTTTAKLTQGCQLYRFKRMLDTISSI